MNLIKKCVANKKLLFTFRIEIKCSYRMGFVLVKKIVLVKIILV